MITRPDRSRNVWFAAAVVALALSPLAAFAKPVAKNDAATAVQSWLKRPGRGLKAPLRNEIASTDVHADAAGAPLYFVVNLKPAGFVIVPADDLVEPILCFCPNGKYIASETNALGALVTHDVPGRLALARANPAAANPPAHQIAAQLKWAQLRAAAMAGASSPGLSSVSNVWVAPLTKSLWDQGDAAGVPCYNYYTPGNDFDGCVATAMAQLMRFYQYPTTSVGTASFPIYVNGTEQMASLRGGNGNGGPYDWADMPLVPGNGVTTVQAQAIGALCYDAGVSVNMQYAGGGSGAYPTNVVPALTSVFHFSNAICGGNGDNVGSGLIGMLNPNLDAGFPCLLSIYTAGDAEGHEIVADGYGYDSSTLYHHLNLGWSGFDNAWYNLPSFSAGGYNWQTVAFCQYNVYPSGSGEIISGQVADTNSNPISGVTVSATRTGGGTYTATTNMYGIYAFAKVPSASSYALTAALTGYTFPPQNVSTGTSATYNLTSGNVWGANFVGTAVGSLPTLTVNSSPIQGVAITGTQPGSTNYSVSSLAIGTAVSLTAPATVTSNGTLFNFVQWTVPTGWTASGVSASGTLNASTTLEADYAAQTWTLTVNSTPIQNVPITGTNPGYTNYTASGILNGTAVSLTAEASFVSGGVTYNFMQWTAPAGWTAAGAAVSGVLNADATLQAQYVAQWTLSVQAPTGSGATTPTTGSHPYAVGVGASVQATPAAGWNFSSWTGNGVPAGQAAANPLTVPSGTAGQTLQVAAVFIQQPQQPQWTLTVQAPTGSGTTIPATGSYQYAVGAGASVQATPAAGWNFDHWTGNGVATGQADSNPLTVASGTSGQTLQVAAVFVQQQWTLSVQAPTGSGTTTPITGSYQYAVGAGASVLATPAAGWKFSSWTGNGVPTGQAGSNPLTVASGTSGQTLQVAAAFVQAPWTLTVNSTPMTGIAVSSTTSDAGATNYSLNVANATVANLTVPAVDPSGYTFTGWQVTANGTATTSTQRTVNFSVTANTAALAQYQVTTYYILNIQSTPVTSVSISSTTGDAGATNYSMQRLATGTAINLSAPATDPTGYTFAQWSLNGKAQAAGQKTLNFTMTSTMTAVAQYSTGGYLLTVESSPISGVAISSSNGDAGTTTYTKTLTSGTAVNLTAPATVVSGGVTYKFVNWTAPATWTVSGVTASGTMQAASVLEANYAAQPTWTLAVQAPTGSGTTTPVTGNYSYAVGTSASIQANAAAGWTFSQWTGNGVTAGSSNNNPLTVASGTSGQTQQVAATFVQSAPPPSQWSLSVNSTPPQGIAITGTYPGTTNYTVANVPGGTVVGLTVPSTDPAGYTFLNWTITLTGQSPVTFTQRSVSFSVTANATAAAAYQATTSGRVLTVQSTPVTGISITSSTGQSGVTNYTCGVTASATVTLNAPAANPVGYTFEQWQLNGTAQTAGQKALTFKMTAASTAIAQYKPVMCMLNVQSTPATAVTVSSATGDGGTTNYSMQNLAYGTSVTLTAPATNASNNAFAQWTLSGAAQPAGQNTISFTMNSTTVTAVAQYTLVTYQLSVRSTPVAGAIVASTTANGNITNYNQNVAAGSRVYLRAATVDPPGYVFSQWTLNGKVQPVGQKILTFTMTAAPATAVAEYSLQR